MDDLYWNPIPEDILQTRCQEIESAEKSGYFDEMFKGNKTELPSYASVNKESFLATFKPEMKLYANTFRRIYGYELTWPGFADTALTLLESLGCSRAREYYNIIKLGIDRKYDESYKKAAEWINKKVRSREAVEEPRRQQELLELLEKKQQILKKLLQIQNDRSTN